MSTQTIEQASCVESPKPLKSIEQMAAEQGIKPFDFEEAWQAAADIWPKYESPDDFSAWLRKSQNNSITKGAH